MPIFEAVAVQAGTGEKRGVTFPEKPDTCPLCGVKVDAPVVYGWLRGESWGRARVLELVFACTSARCRRLFVAYYTPFDDNRDYFQLRHTLLPVQLEARHFADSVMTTSPRFVEVYNEARLGEANGLRQICGCGYRRSLEFLVKDYLISQLPSEKAAIQQEQLGKSIQRVTDANLRATAERAAWLGNDETHYVRRWEDMDLSHLKDLIELTVNWVDSSIRTAGYRRDMPGGR